MLATSMTDSRVWPRARMLAIQLQQHAPAFRTGLTRRETAFVARAGLHALLPEQTNHLIALHASAQSSSYQHWHGSKDAAQQPHDLTSAGRLRSFARIM